MTRRPGAVLGIAILLVALCAPSGRAQSDGPVIAAASSLSFALEEVAQAFTTETGSTVRLSFGASGNLTTQIRQGAPFEMLLSADDQFVSDLFEDGFAPDQGTIYAEGRLVIAVPHGSALKPDGTLEALAQALDAGTIERFAIANPEHAPYGMRAREALEHAGLWESIAPFLVYGENVGQAAQFALSGDTQGGLIPYSLVLDETVGAMGAFDLVPASYHAPLLHRMALMEGAGPVAKGFHDFVTGEKARAILARYGFVLPQDDAQ